MLVYGRLGAGKTSYAVMRAVREARAYRLPMYSNAAVRDRATGEVVSPVVPGSITLSDWTDLEALPLDNIGRHPAVVLLDELHLWYPSATGLMPKERLQDAFELLSFARKRGWSIYATAQAPTRVHTGYRQLITELVRVKSFSEGFLHTAALMDPDNPAKEELPFYGAFNPRRVRYNTRAEVQPLWRASRAAAAPTRATPPPFDPTFVGSTPVDPFGLKLS